jgi:D-glycero-D-manno-heptose 1,7-bisphosphate phosphatase
MSEPTPRLVVLDRDGVINKDSAEFIRAPAEWIPLPGSLGAIAALTRSGFTVVVASNQSGVGRGLFTAETLEAIHARMCRDIEAAGGRLGGIFVCPHHPEAGCDCRKPKPGLLRQIERRFGCSLAGQPAIGDSERDLRAAQAVGARAILVRTGNGAATEKALGSGPQIEIYDDLAAAARVLLAETDPRPA